MIAHDTAPAPSAGGDFKDTAVPPAVLKAFNQTCRALTKIRAGAGRAPACSVPQYRLALTAHLLGISLIASYRLFPFDLGIPARAIYARAYPAMVTDLLRHEGRNLDEIRRAVQQACKEQLNADAQGGDVTDRVSFDHVRVVRYLNSWLAKAPDILDASRALFADPAETPPAPGSRTDLEHSGAPAELAGLMPQTLMLNADLLNRVFDYVIPARGQMITARAPMRGTDTLLFLDIPELKDTCLTPFDRRVLEAACTIWASGATIVTPKVLARMIRGLDRDEWVSPAARDEVLQSISVMQSTKIKLSFKARGRQCSVQDTVLPCAIISLPHAAGEPYTAVKLHAAPPLYALAKARGHIITVPARALAIKHVDEQGAITDRPVYNTATMEAVKDYLLRRIVLMSPRRGRPIAQSNRILWRSVLESAGGSSPTAKTRICIRNIARTCLAYWKAMGLISDYTASGRDKAIIIAAVNPKAIAA